MITARDARTDWYRAARISATMNAATRKIVHVCASNVRAPKE
jgi:hypothetical protein